MGKSKKFQKEIDGKFEKRLEPRKAKHLPYGTKINVSAIHNNNSGGHNNKIYIHDEGEYLIKSVDKSWIREENKRLTKKALEQDELDYYNDEIYYNEDYDMYSDNDITDEDYEKYKHLIINQK